jgi:hypothetical protein
MPVTVVYTAWEPYEGPGKLQLHDGEIVCAIQRTGSGTTKGFRTLVDYLAGHVIFRVAWLDGETEYGAKMRLRCLIKKAKPKK